MKKNTHRVPKAAVLMAAVIMLLAGFCITAYAANIFGLRDLLLPERQEITPPSDTELASKEPHMSDAISLAGYADTNESRATAEWQAFLSSYDADGSILAGVGNNIFGAGTSYMYYQVYTQEMADKLDTIADRYGLKLHTDIISDIYTNEELCEQVGGDFLGENQIGSAYLYEDGTFHFDGEIELDGYGHLDYQFLRCVRGSLTDILLVIGDVNDYTEWTYTTVCGLPVTLAIAPNKSLIIVNLPDSFVTVNVLAGTETSEYDIFSSGPFTAENLERFADSFDFNVLTPARPADYSLLHPTMSDITIDPDYDGVRAAYAAVLKKLLHEHILPDGSECEPYMPMDINEFAICDVNGDGVDELILLFTNTYYAGQAAYVMSYDEETEDMHIELREFPMLTFYNNGIIKAYWSHNQGLAGDSLWPFTLYSYDYQTGSYVPVAMVDAWDKSVSETYQDQAFPDEVDISGTGVVYYIMTEGVYDTSHPVDIAEYNAWLSKYIGYSDERLLPYVSLTEENILQLESSQAVQ
ncbi:MAG: hypothetical protein PUB32_06650 [Clostridiales bacterium]|nr:hypothetical protein [Clostridiales bacterium]